MSSLRLSCWRSLLTIAITGVSIFPGSYTVAQMNLDGSVDNNISNVKISNDLKVIEGGTQVGNKLSESFSELSITSTDSVHINAEPLTISSGGNLSINSTNLIPPIAILNHS